MTGSEFRAAADTSDWHGIEVNLRLQASGSSGKSPPGSMARDRGSQSSMQRLYIELLDTRKLLDWIDQMSKEKAKAPLRIRRLRRSELPSDTIRLAKYLIGKTLVHDLPGVRLSGRIVETEAYPVGDTAAHAFRGKTPGNRSLFLRHGHAYVYFTYGSSFMMNVSSEAAGTGAGVLLRALEPLEGIPFMQRKRGTTCLADLARGPGRLAQAMDIDKRYDGANLCAGGELWLGAAVRRTGAIGTTTRIGITRDVHRPYRFYECGSPFVSGPKRSLS